MTKELTSLAYYRVLKIGKVCCIRQRVRHCISLNKFIERVELTSNTYLQRMLIECYVSMRELLILVNYEECSLLDSAQLLDFPDNIQQMIVNFLLQRKNIFHEIKATRTCSMHTCLLSSFWIIALRLADTLLISDSFTFVARHLRRQIKMCYK